MDPRVRALNRFGLGARLGQVQTVADPKGWLLAQLRDAERPGGPEGTGADSPGDGALATTPFSLEEASEPLVRLRTAMRDGDQGAVAEARRNLRDVTTREMTGALTRRLSSRAPFVERLVAFWSNHLCVSALEPQVAPLAGHYERTAIRPHVLGRFEDMVLASARHPAMLLYLDNAQSVGPGSPAGVASGRRGNGRGLNENYARELLELHTLGVDGGYEQRDVEALARMLTGWGVVQPSPGGAGGRGGSALQRRRRERLMQGSTRDDAPGFVFRSALHEPGSKTLLGARYDEAGEREAEDAIRDLCRHPSTARFVATKLATHFVADDPAPEAVEELAGAFRSSGGDLALVSRALVDLDAAWQHDARKLRTPQDWLVAALRAFHVENAPDTVAGVLRQLRHTPWAPAAPKGYPDLARDWSDPDSLMNRAELARSLSRRLVGGARGPGGGRFEPVALTEVVEIEEDDPLHGLLADDSIEPAERVALLLGGPAFQWR